MPVAMNMSHDSSSARAFGVFSGRNFPVFSARYVRIAVLSKTRTPPSVMVGVLLLGLIATKLAANCSPFRVSTGTTSYGRPDSSRNSATFAGFGEGW